MSFSILDAAQEFTTGSNETGYTLSSIDLETHCCKHKQLPRCETVQRLRKRNRGCHVDRADKRIYWENHLHLHGAHSHHAGWETPVTGSWLRPAAGTWHTVGYRRGRNSRRRLEDY